MEEKIVCMIVGDIETNCWLYATGDVPDARGLRPCIVIDPGDRADLIVSRLAELKWIPVYILFTHGHFDHLLALPELLAAFKKTPGTVPRIGIHRLDAEYLGKNAKAVHMKSFSAAGGNPAYIESRWKELPEADILFEEGDTVGPFKVLHLPGHSPGSAGFYDEKTGVLFSGDTLFMGTWGRTDLPGGNESQLRQSLKRVLSMKKEIVVCSGHGPATTIGEEAANLLSAL